MHALVNAFSKVRPCLFRRVRPGRLSFSQLTGKCWMARSWSVMKRMTFLSRRRRGPWFPCAALARDPSPKIGAEIAATFSSSLRVSRSLRGMLTSFASISALCTLIPTAIRYARVDGLKRAFDNIRQATVQSFG